MEEHAENSGEPCWPSEAGVMHRQLLQHSRVFTKSLCSNNFPKCQDGSFSPFQLSPHPNTPEYESSDTVVLEIVKIRFLKAQCAF